MGAAKLDRNRRMLEIKKSKKVQLDDKRVTFFLLGLLLAFTFLFVGLQYHKSPAGRR